jgi:2-polyprenyl-6-hydroxyphenyl methylase/3-demethylubiquinone-9 3-methyltransferase
MAQSAEMRASGTVDAEDVRRFGDIAAEWWDPDGKFAPLHRFNPIRLTWLRDRLCDRFGRDPRSLRPLEGLRVLDIGCGGGLIAEPLARMGASVTGVDASERNIRVAQAHAAAETLTIDYRAATAEALAEAGERFDAVVALEVVEHVADLTLFLDCCARLVRPRGALALASLNRTPKSFLFAIVGAEYVMRWLPRGTHDWRKFPRPSEIAAVLGPAGLRVADTTGMTYDPLGGDWRQSRDLSVNYALFAHKDKAA